MSSFRISGNVRLWDIRECQAVGYQGMSGCVISGNVRLWDIRERPAV
jgi:hypothetical protein